MLNDLIENFFKALTAERVALFSILVTLLTFVIGKQRELKMKKQEMRRVEYKQLIDVLQKVYSNEFKVTNKNDKKLFFDTGASLLIYGSKKLYKEYIFFRDYSSNLIISKSKYNDKKNSIYLIAKMLKLIRKEVGLSFFNELDSNEVLSFFINDIANNSVELINSYKIKRNIFMIKFELMLDKIMKLTLIKKIYYLTISPLFEILKLIIFKFIIYPLYKIFYFMKKSILVISKKK